jgi:hypothetical protein
MVIAFLAGVAVAVWRTGHCPALAAETGIYG